MITNPYADPDVTAALRRHHVDVPDEADWTVAGPFYTYVALPVPAALLRELYNDIGLTIHHIALLIGLGDFATRNRLLHAGVTFRPDRNPAHGTAAVTPAADLSQSFDRSTDAWPTTSHCC